MGMFDTVVIEGLKLPNLPKDISTYLKKNNAPVPSEFQTKDLDNVLSTFTINKNGQIYVTEYRPTGKKIPYESPFKGWKDNRSLIERLYYKLQEKKITKNFPDLKMVDERKPVKVKSKLTHTFNIGSYDEIGGRYVDLDFNVVAVNGIVKTVKLVTANIEPEKEANGRKARNAEWEINMQKSFENRKKFTSKWYYPIIKEIYNPFVFFSRLALQGLANQLTKLSHRISGV